MDRGSLGPWFDPRQLCAAGADPSPFGRHFSPARAGDTARITSALDKGIDINAKAGYDMTALIFAADNGRLDAVKLLVARGADVNARDTFYHFRAVDLAMINGHVDVAIFLLQNGSKGGDDALTFGVQSNDAALVRAALASDLTRQALQSAMALAERTKRADLASIIKAALKPLDDLSEHEWKLYCVDKTSGKIVWERTAFAGAPQTKRHPKASQANSTPVMDGQHIVTAFGAVGLLVAWDMNGKELCRADIGVVNSGWFLDPTYQWGHGSSPVIYQNVVILQADMQKRLVPGGLGPRERQTGPEDQQDRRNLDLGDADDCSHHRRPRRACDQRYEDSQLRPSHRQALVDPGTELRGDPDLKQIASNDMHVVRSACR